MNSQYHRDTDLHDLDDLRSSGESDREISLGTATVVGIFLALALVCAVFFGFGYSLGRRSAQPALPAAEAAATPLSSSGTKPAPGSRTPALAQKTVVNTDSDQQNASPEAAPSTPQSLGPAFESAREIEPSARPAAKTAATSSPAPRVVPASTAGPAITPATSPGAAIVQVAAVSHQDDADVLLTALRKRGYSVAIRHEPQDKLLHVQIGPFPSKKEAEAMRQRLLSDGYNAIVK